MVLEMFTRHTEKRNVFFIIQISDDYIYSLGRREYG